MDHIPYDKLGALERPKDERDFPLGAVSLPVARGPRLGVDLSWLKRNYQAQLPFCGPHAGSHNKAIQDHAADNSLTPRYTPRFTAVRMKDPASPVYDHYAPDAGTDMRQLLNSFKAIGANQFDPLENDTTLPIDQYLSPSVITPAMEQDAKGNLISSYAFGNADYDSICDAIWKWKSVVLLVKCDEGFWGTSTPTFTNPKYGHFIDAYDYDDEKGGIWVIDSAEPNEQFALKWIAKQYIQPQFFFELGTTVDIPRSIHQALSQQQFSLAQEILADFEKILHLDQLLVPKGRQAN